MLRRTVFLFVATVSLAISIEAQQQRQLKQTKSPITSIVNDSGGTELIVRLLDVGQGDATYIRNGSSRVIIDGGPDPVAFGRYLDSLGLNNSTLDVVILSHQHLDHYTGTVGGGFTITPERRAVDLDGPSDRFARQASCGAGGR